MPLCSSGSRRYSPRRTWMACSRAVQSAGRRAASSTRHDSAREPARSAPSRSRAPGHPLRADRAGRSGRSGRSGHPPSHGRHRSPRRPTTRPAATADNHTQRTHRAQHDQARRSPWPTREPHDSAVRRRAQRQQLLSRLVLVLDVVERRLRHAVEGQEPLRGQRRRGVGVTAVPVRLDLVLQQRPIVGAAQVRLRLDDAEREVGERLLELEGAALLWRAVAVGFGAELGDQQRLVGVAGVRLIEVVAEQIPVGDRAVGSGYQPK